MTTHAGRFRLLVGLACAVLAPCGLVAQARAATYTVGTNADTTGSCPNPASGACSLRQLINYENGLATTPSPTDTIAVPAGSYALSSGALLITQSVTIAGAGARTATVSQASSTPDRVFDIQIPGSHVVPSVTISGLAVTGGTANSSNGFYGGDVRSQGTLTLSEDWIEGGSTTAGSGAGISNDGGTLTVTRSLVSGNTSTFSNGGGDSGGIQNVGPNPVTGTAGSLEVDNSTISGNTAALGGGIYSWGDSSNKTAVVDSTIANNDGGTRVDQPNSGGLLSNSGGPISVQNSIVAFNTVDAPSPGTASNCGSTGIASLGYNLETGTDCGFRQTGDLQSTDPQFSSSGNLQDNGGNTGSFAPKLASAAVDHIPLGTAGCSGSDQRDIARPQGAGCDIGAVELLQPVEGQSFSTVVANTSCAVSGTPSINWGDGTSSSGTPPQAAQPGAITGTHTYAEEGTYSVTTTWTDDCGSHSSSFSIRVPDAPLSAQAVAVTAIAGTTFTGPTTNFTDADPGATSSDYVASIDWGDGTTSAGTIVTSASGFTVNGTHTYKSAGAYPMKVSIVDAASPAVVNPASTVAPPKPVVTGVSPSSGSALGGNRVTVSGSGFSGATAVSFGSTPASSFTVVSDGQITAVAPAGTGTVDVTVTTPSGTSATGAADQYTFVAAAPAVTTGAPTVQSSTGAAFTGSVNPRGLATTAHFEYFLDPQYGTVTVLSTPDQAAGSDTSDHVVSASVSGLVPNALYHVRLVASNSAGRTTGPDQTFTTAKDPPPPAPVVGKSFDVGPVSGLVFIKLPGGMAPDRAGGPPLAHAAASTGAGFVPLTEARNLPAGTQVDASRGTIQLIAARPHSHQTEDGNFGGAIFNITQSRRGAGITTLSLLEGLFPGAPSYASCHHHLSHQVLQTLHASDRRHFRSRGGYASATVRGTVWITIDRCDGTLIIVKRGTVYVNDFVHHTTVILHAGQRYLAKARTPHR